MSDIQLHEEQTSFGCIRKVPGTKSDCDEVPGVIQRDEVPGAIQRDEVMTVTQRDEAPGVIQRDEVPGVIQRDEVMTVTQRDEVPGVIQRDEVPGVIQRDEVPGVIQRDEVMIVTESGGSQPGQVSHVDTEQPHSNYQADNHHKLVSSLLNMLPVVNPGFVSSLSCTHTESVTSPCVLTPVYDTDLNETTYITASDNDKEKVTTDITQFSEAQSQDAQCENDKTNTSTGDKEDLSDSNCIKEAIDMIGKAILNENKGDQEHMLKAFMLYRAGVKHLLTLHKTSNHLQNVEKRLIREICRLYLDRAKILKESLEDAQEPDLFEEDDHDDLQGLLHDIHVDKACQIRWADVAGMERLRQRLTEHIVLPLKYPQLFSGMRRSLRRNIMIYGPKGTGKSYIVRAMLRDLETPCYMLHMSDIINKFEDGKMCRIIRSIFQFLQCKQPCVLLLESFGNAIDTLFHRRRCVFTELLVQMRGCENGDVNIILNTDQPWHMRSHIRRLFVYRWSVGLPSLDIRRMVVHTCFSRLPCTTDLSDLDLEEISIRTAHYTCTDIEKLFWKAHVHCSTCYRSSCSQQFLDNLSTTQPGENKFPAQTQTCASPDVVDMDLFNIDDTSHCDHLLNMDDFRRALTYHKSSVDSETLEKYKQFARNFGPEDDGDSPTVGQTDTRHVLCLTSLCKDIIVKTIGTINVDTIERLTIPRKLKLFLWV